MRRVNSSGIESFKTVFMSAILISRSGIYLPRPSREPSYPQREKFLKKSWGMIRFHPRSSRVTEGFYEVHPWFPLCFSGDSEPVLPLARRKQARRPFARTGWKRCLLFKKGNLPQRNRNARRFCCAKSHRSWLCR